MASGASAPRPGLVSAPPPSRGRRLHRRRLRALPARVFPGSRGDRALLLEQTLGSPLPPGPTESPPKFERKFKSEKAAGSVSKSTQFEYAWCLVRSKYNDDIRKGLALLEELLPKGSKEEQRDYVFYLAVGNYRLKEYEKALKYVRGLLQTEPQNNQAKELERLIDKAMKKDGLVGMAIVGGMALGVAGLAGLIGLAVSKSKS
uniref:Fission, mitochondrial 1 n=1 Tax=Bos taurus TaxID=9913 RepID=A0AAF6YRL4_BOVIN